VTTAGAAIVLLVVAAILAATVPLRTVRLAAGSVTLAGAALLLCDALNRFAAPGTWSTFRIAVALSCAASAVLASGHALGYASAWDGKRRSRVLATCFPVFLAGLYAVVLAEDYWSLLTAWEVMTLASAALVGIDLERPDSRQALIWYLGIGQLSPVAFTLAAAVAVPDTWSIDGIAAAITAAPPGAQSAAFIALLLGAAAKAGLIPVHTWLPLAHPAAPGHVSAVMSGAMVTTGLLVFTRLAPLDAASAHPWWGWIMLAAGVASAFLGVLNALVDGDLKRVLACSTIENMGLLTVELALGLRLLPVPATVAELALTAALLHVMAHALAKTGLFLAAGSLIHASGTRLLGRMGGLIRVAPLPAVAFILCAASVAAIPPLTGFAAELLLIRSLVGAAHELTGFAATAVALATALLALAGALAVGAYARVIGIALLGSPRSGRASTSPGTRAHARDAHVHPVSAPEKAAALIPGLLLLLAPAAMAPIGALSPAVTPGASTLAEVGGVAWLLVGLALMALALTRGHVVRPTVRAPWSCGISIVTSRMQYTPDSFSQPVVRVFAALVRPSVTIDVDTHPAAEHTVRSRTYNREAAHIVDDALWGPLMALFSRVATRGRRLQSGSISRYAAWMLVGTLGVLAAMRWLS